jgi:hypothetical protein
MKKLLSITAITFFAIVAGALASPEKEKIITAEKNAWQLIKDKKFDDFEKMLGPDFRGVYSSGINMKAKEVTEVRTLDFKSYTLGEMDVVFIDRNTALIAYPVTVEGTESGKDISSKMNAASIWKKEGGAWHIAFHTDMNAK